MGFLRLFGALSPAHISLFTWLSRKERVGSDVYGNIYYRAPAQTGQKRQRRWVIYNGVPEASLVPPEWHGWLHYQTDSIPEDTGVSFRRFWQKPHQPNRTGTTLAYYPPGHITQGGKREKATGDYTAWSPPR